MSVTKFITADNQFVGPGTMIYEVTNLENEFSIHEAIVGISDIELVEEKISVPYENPDGLKFFSNEFLAKEYILNHKKLFSVEDIKTRFGFVMRGHLKDLEDFADEKLN